VYGLNRRPKKLVLISSRLICNRDNSKNKVVIRKILRSIEWIIYTLNYVLG
jgi:hypothetical protein